MAMELPVKLNCHTQVMAVTSSSGTKLINQRFQGAANIRIYNAGPNDAFIASYYSGGTAITAVFPTTITGQNGTVIGAGAVEVFEKNSYLDDTLVAICASGNTATLYVQPSGGV